MWDQVPLVHNASLTRLLYLSDAKLLLKQKQEKIVIESCNTALLRFTAKWRGKYRDFPYSPCPHTYTASSILSIINVLHQSGPFVKSDRPTMTHHYHPKSIVYIRVHSWWRTSYGFGQIYNDMYLLL